MKTTIKLIALCFVISIFQSCNETASTTQQADEQEKQQTEQTAENQATDNTFWFSEKSRD